MTDEQRMREQFEALRLPPDKWSQDVRDRLFKRDEFNYLDGKIDREWHGFRDGYRARDAEVQALKELARDAVAFIDPVSPYGQSLKRLYKTLTGELEGGGS